MALTKILSEFTYQSASGGVSYYFTIVVNQQGTISVKNILTPYGLVDSVVSVPNSVMDDVQIAIGQVEDLMAQTSAINGNLTFAAETSQPVVFSIAFANTNYRVYVAADDYVTWRITNKTTAGFTIELGTTFTGTIGYDVFV